MKKIAVIGSGIIGITTAYELACQGNEVTVYDRNSAAAEETSFANACLFAPSFVTPWVAPGLPGVLLKNLFKEHSPARLGWLGSSDLSWISNWRVACKMDHYLVHRSQLHSLASFSNDVFKDITRQLSLEFEQSRGLLVLFRGKEEQKNAQKAMQAYREMGISFSEISPDKARSLEPALNIETPLVGGLYFPDDGVANCRQFALMLKDHCERMGINFKFNQFVEPLSALQPTAIKTHADLVAYDAVVVCAGVHSAQLLAPLGINLPLKAIYGYSLSAAVRESIDAPLSAVLDERYKVTLSRIGQRIRVAGIAQIGGSHKKPLKYAYQTLYKVLNDWFPGGARTSESVQEWQGARATLPEGLPIIGASKVPGVWLNLGHGSSGWTLSCGAARALANLIEGKLPGTNLIGFGSSRLG